MLKRKIKMSFENVSVSGPSVAIPKKVDLKLQVHHCIMLHHSSRPPDPLSTLDPYSSLVLRSSHSCISQCISLLWQKSV